MTEKYRYANYQDVDPALHLIVTHEQLVNLLANLRQQIDEVNRLAHSPSEQDTLSIFITNLNITCTILGIDVDNLQKNSDEQKY